MSVRVFISYRHSDGRHVAGRLRDRLADSFGDDNVFFDVESIAFGLDFRTVISERLQTVDVVIALIGPHFDLERLAQPNDVVRLELTEAFRLDKLVVPVLVGDAPIPSPDDLPDELERLAYLRAAPLRDDPDFRTDVARLIESLTATVARRRDPSSAAAPAPPGPAPESGLGPPPTLSLPAEPSPVVLTVGSPRRLDRHHTKQIRSLAFSPDGSRLLSGGDGRTAELWDPTSGELVHVLRGHTSWVLDVAYAPDGRTVATASQDGSARLWDPGTGEPTVTLGSTAGDADDEHGDDDHGGLVLGIGFTDDGDTVVTAGTDPSIRTWRRDDGRLLLRILAHEDGVAALACSPAQRLVATGGGSADPTVRLWDPADGTQVAVLAGHGGPLASLAFSPDGRLLASGSADGTVRVWQVADHRPLRTFSNSTRPYAVAFSPDSRLVASGSSDKSVRVWDWTVGSLVATLGDHGNLVQAVAFAPHGRLLASAGGGEFFRGDNQIRLWPLGDP